MENNLHGYRCREVDCFSDLSDYNNHNGEISSEEKRLDSTIKCFYQDLKDEFNMYLEQYIKNYVSYKATNFPEGTDRMFNSFASKIMSFEECHSVELIHKNVYYKDYKEDFIHYLLQNHIIKTNTVLWDKNQRQKYPIFFNRRLKCFLSQIGCTHLLNELDTNYSRIVFVNDHGGYDVESSEGGDISLWGAEFLMGMFAPVFASVAFIVFLFRNYLSVIILGSICLVIWSVVSSDRYYKRYLFGEVYYKYMNENSAEKIEQGDNAYKISSNSISEDEILPTTNSDIDGLLSQAECVLMRSCSSGLYNVLLEIRKNKKILKKTFKSHSQYELFIQTRLYQYIEPYLNFIIDKNGEIDAEHTDRFLKTFQNLNEILETKIQKIHKERDLTKDIEFNVIEKEIKRALEEEKWL